MSTSRPFPGFDHIYLVHQEAASPIFLAKLEEPLATESLGVFAGDTPSGPCAASWAMGSPVPADFVWNTLGRSVLLSERVVRMLQGSGVTGWHPIHTRLADPQGAEVLSRYSFLQVLGRCGPIDYSRSEGFDKPRPGGVFKYIRGLYFDPLSWSGDDVFTIEGKAFIFVTQSFVDATSMAELSNVRFERLTAAERRAPANWQG
jgi:hypothetical protein